MGDLILNILKYLFKKKDINFTAIELLSCKNLIELWFIKELDFMDFLITDAIKNFSDIDIIQSIQMFSEENKHVFLNDLKSAYKQDDNIDKDTYKKIKYLLSKYSFKDHQLSIKLLIPYVKLYYRIDIKPKCIKDNVLDIVIPIEQFGLYDRGK